MLLLLLPGLSSLSDSSVPGANETTLLPFEPEVNIIWNPILIQVLSHFGLIICHIYLHYLPPFKTWEKQTQFGELRSRNKVKILIPDVSGWYGDIHMSQSTASHLEWP